MKQDTHEVLLEIREMLKVLVNEQQQLMKDIKDLKEEQRKLKEEVRLSNFVLNNISFKSEIIN